MDENYDIDENIKRSMTHVERLHKVKRINNLKSEINRERWVRNHWKQGLGVAVAASFLGLILFTFLPQSQSVIDQNKILVFGTDNSKLSDSINISLKSKNSQSRINENSPSRKDIFKNTVDSIQQTQILTEDTDKKFDQTIASHEGVQNIPPENQTIHFPDNITNPSQASSQQTLNSSNSKSNSASIYLKAKKHLLEDGELISKTDVVLVFVSSPTSKYVLKQDTIFVHLSDTKQTNLLRTYSTKNPKTIELWVNPQNMLIIDTREILGDFIKVK